MKLFGAVLITIPTLVCAANDTELFFRRFFPTYDAAFQRILKDNCSDVMQYYLAAEAHGEDGSGLPPPITKDGWSAVNLADAFGYDNPENFVVECILKATPEIIKTKMATSQVLLGLTPSLLALLAPGQHQTGLVAIAAGHPLLAVLLAAGSPTVSVIQSLDYTKGIEVINTRRLKVPNLFRSNGAIILLAEYMLALASIANIIEISFRIFQQILFTFSLGTEWVIFLWSFVGMVIHLLGTVAVSSRVKLMPESESGSEKDYMASIRTYFNIFRRPESVRVRVVPESFHFYVVSWIASVLTVSHLFFGSMLFSSVLFISVEDASLLLVRLMASVVVCKLVIMYELFYLQGVVTVVEEDL